MNMAEEPLSVIFTSRTSPYFERSTIFPGEGIPHVWSLVEWMGRHDDIELAPEDLPL